MWQHQGIELVQCSTARTKTALFLLNPRFYHRLDSPLQYPGIDFSGEAEECDPPIVVTHPLVPFLKRGTTTPFATPRDAMLQRRVSQDSPTTSRDLRYSGQISSTPDALPLRSLQTTSVTSAWVMDESTPESSISASSRKACQWDWGDPQNIPSTIR